MITCRVTIFDDIFLVGACLNTMISWTWTFKSSVADRINEIENVTAAIQKLATSMNTNKGTF